MLSTRYKAAKFAIYVLVLLALTVMQNTPGLFAIMNIKPHAGGSYGHLRCHV